MTYRVETKSGTFEGLDYWGMEAKVFDHFPEGEYGEEAMESFLKTLETCGTASHNDLTISEEEC